MKKNILVLPAGTEIGHEIYEALRYSKHWALLGANSVRDHSEVLYSRLLPNFPSVYDPGFVDAVNDAVARHGVDVVFPAHDEAIVRLSGNLHGALFAGPRPELAVVLRSKAKTLAALSGVVPVPRVYVSGERPTEFPVFVKPDCGQGSRGARLINDEKQFESLMAGGEDLIVQQALPGEEVTVDCYSNREARVLYVQPRLRLRISGGIATRMAAYDDQELADQAQAISSALKLFGPWFFQMKRDREGRFRLLEVANRVAGSMGFQRNLGVNLVDAFLHELFGATVSFYKNNLGEMIYDRALYEQTRWSYRPAAIYVDFDDTLQIDSALANYRLIGLLYGCRINLGSRIVLLTRHAGDLHAKLQTMGIQGLFDEIVTMDRHIKKSAYITITPALFIDDSYAERQEVAMTCNIPCLPLESIALLEGCLR